MCKIKNKTFQDSAETLLTSVNRARAVDCVEVTNLMSSVRYYLVLMFHKVQWYPHSFLNDFHHPLDRLVFHPFPIQYQCKSQNGQNNTKSSSLK